MIPRRSLLILVATLAVLLVAFAVAMTGYARSAAAQDAAAARALWWLAMAILMLVGTDLVLLVGVLRGRELEGEEE